MRIVVAPDSFKGSLTAAQASEAISRGLKAAGHEPARLPIADGGEGTVAAFLEAAGGQRRVARVAGPYGSPVDAEWALLPDGSAVVELAAAAGLGLVGEDRRTGQASTYGLGELILAAAHAGARSIAVGLGGSATTDGGCGAAAACGVRFLDHDGESFVPIGATLARVSRIDASRTNPVLATVPLTALRDVTNPLTGPTGAAAVFGPQKGASEDEVRLLDRGLAHLAEVIRRDLGSDIAGVPGAGAAGGAGGGMAAFLGARLVPGVEAVLAAVRFEEELGGADAVVTGEGSFDAQSLSGKATSGVAEAARRARVPVHVLAGAVESSIHGQLHSLGIASARSIVPEGMEEAEALTQARELLEQAAQRLGREL